MSLRLPIAVTAAALIAAGALVLVSAAPALAITTVSGSGTGTILTQEGNLQANHLSPAGPGAPQDVAVAGSDVYVANYTEDVVDVYSETDGSFITSIPIGTSPISIAASTDGTKVYVLNQGSDNVAVITTSTNTATNLFATDASPTRLAVSSSHIYIYYDGAENASEYTFGGADVGDSPTFSTVTTGTAMTVSPDGSRVYITYRDGIAPNTDGALVVLDSGLNLVTSVALPSPEGVAVSPDSSTVYVSGTTTANVGHVVSLTASNDAATGKDAIVSAYVNALVTSPDGAWVYGASSNQGNVSVVDTSAFTSVSEGATGATDEAISPDGLHLYVANATGHNTDVFAIAKVTVSAAATIAAGTASTPFDVSVVDGNTPVDDYSADTVVVKLYNSANAVVATSPSVPMTVAGDVTIPVDTSALPSGTYHAIATLIDSTDGTATAATVAGIAVRSTLATTGQDETGAFVLGLGLLGAGVALFALRLAPRRRRIVTVEPR
jgi:YVTN family beta-propeller protein